MTDPGWATELPRGSGLFCHYAWSPEGDDTEHPSATHRVHDSRGCVACCGHCMRWRASLNRSSGHGETCPDHGVLASPG